MITATRKAELTAKGFRVEDMHPEWGGLYEGRYRWVLNAQEDWGDILFNEESAWANADQHDRLHSD